MMPDLSDISLGGLPAIDDDLLTNSLDRLLAGPGALMWQNYAYQTPVFEARASFEDASSKNPS